MSLHSTPVDVRFGDTDMFGHVNNAAFATYSETARLAFFRDRLGGTRERPGGAAGGLILAHMAIDFRKQLLYGAEAQVTTGVVRLGRSSISIKQEVRSAGEVVADIATVVVAFDYDQQKAVALSDEARGLLEESLIG